jgi:hypothetical protein
MTSFPERVWERAFIGGWVSRPATPKDTKRRALIAVVLSSSTARQKIQANHDLGYTTNG